MDLELALSMKDLQNLVVQVLGLLNLFELEGPLTELADNPNSKCDELCKQLREAVPTYTGECDPAQTRSNPCCAQARWSNPSKTS